MAVVDLLVLAAAVVGVSLGAIRGFVPQVVGVFGLGGGLYLSARFHAIVRARLLEPNFEWSYNGEAAFVGIIVLTIAVAALIGFMLRKMIEACGLSTYDRIAGAALGAAKAGATAAVLLLAIVYFAPDGGGLERAIGASRAAPALWRAMDEMAEALPDRVGDPMETFLDANDLPAKRKPVGLDLGLPVPEQDEGALIVEDPAVSTPE